MATRCKPGDLAIITYDVPSCTPNIGRLVRVDGPPEVNRRGQTTWLIEPVTYEPYMLNDWGGNFTSFMNIDDDNIEHPDDWMVPIRPDEQDDDTEAQDILTREEEVVTCR